MRSEQLQYLIAMKYNSSLYAASQTLNVTPQAIGQGIKALENEWNIPLLLRSGKKVTLTPAAEEIIQASEIYFHNLKTIFDKYQTNPENKQKSLSVSIFSQALDFLLPGVIANFYQTCPNTLLDIRSNNRATTFERVLSGTDEFAIYGNLFVNDVMVIPLDKNFTFVPLKTFYLGYGVHEKHPLADKASLSLKDFDQETIVLLNGHENGMLDLVREFSTHYGIHPNIINEKYPSIHHKLLETGAASTLGMLFDILKNPLIPKQNSLVYIPAIENVHLTVGYLKLKSHILTTESVTFLNLLQKSLLSN